MLTAAALHDLEAALPVPEPPVPTPTPGTTGPIRPPRIPPIVLGAVSDRLALGASRLTLARALTRADDTPALLTEADVVDIASDYGDQHLGDGIERLAAAFDRDAELWVGASGLALALDRAARDVAAADLAEFVKDAGAAVRAKDAGALARLTGAEG